MLQERMARSQRSHRLTGDDGCFRGSSSTAGTAEKGRDLAGSECQPPGPWSEKLPFANLGLTAVPDPCRRSVGLPCDPRSGRSSQRGAGGFAPKPDSGSHCLPSRERKLGRPPVPTDMGGKRMWTRSRVGGGAGNNGVVGL
jgi:hypothetical protein